METRRSTQEEQSENLLPLSHYRKRSKFATKDLPLFIVVQAIVSILLSIIAYYYGYRHGKFVAVPRLPTYEITKDAFRLQLQSLDDAFEVKKEENAVFKGPPRPEQEHAWRDLLRGINIRVQGNLAAHANFKSFELVDNSGDLFATPYVFHQLHCLKTIREAQYPDRYPSTYEYMKPLEDGNISQHFDHCLENIRQGIMCQGDLTLFGYSWPENSARPQILTGAQHLCVDWSKLYNWAVAHRIDIRDEKITGKYAASLLRPEDFQNR